MSNLATPEIHELHTRWYKQLRSLIDADYRYETECSDSFQEVYSAYRRTHYELIDRLSRRRSIFERFCGYPDDERSYKEFAELCDRHYLPERSYEYEWKEPEDTIQLSFLLIDSPEQHRMRYLKNLSSRKDLLLHNVLAHITTIQKESPNSLEMFYTVATVKFMEFLRMNKCVHCGRKF